jgi:hypothetical protein
MEDRGFAAIVVCLAPFANRSIDRIDEAYLEKKKSFVSPICVHLSLQREPAGNHSKTRKGRDNNMGELTRGKNKTSTQKYKKKKKPRHDGPPNSDLGTKRDSDSPSLPETAAKQSTLRAPRFFVCAVHSPLFTTAPRRRSPRSPPSRPARTRPPRCFPSCRARDRPASPPASP